MSDGVFQVQLRRMDTSQPWGFRLKGGADQGIPLHVETCAPNSRAGKSGIQAGDMVLSICGMAAQGMAHAQVKQEVLRAGNEVDFVMQRGALTGGMETQAAAAPVPQPKPTHPPQQQAVRQRPAPRQQQQSQEPRVQVLEEPTVKMGGATFKNVTPKTYKVLKEELPASETGQAQRPASIFNRNKGERSGYLQSKGPTIQKAYGQKY